MNRNMNILEAARKAEKVGEEVRSLLQHYSCPEATNAEEKRVILRFAGSLCSMTASILCELYETDGDPIIFDKGCADMVLREWGIDELERA